MMNDPPGPDVKNMQRQWQWQHVTHLRTGPAKAGMPRHMWPHQVALTEDSTTNSGAVRMANDVVASADARLGHVPQPATYSGASMVSHASACGIQGGGSPSGKGPDFLWKESAKVAGLVAPGGKPWKPGLTDQDDNNFPDQGHTWDFWTILNMFGASHAAPHKDGYPELAVQWPPSGRDGMEFTSARESGIAMCNASISEGSSPTPCARVSCGTGVPPAPM